MYSSHFTCPHLEAFDWRRTELGSPAAAFLRSMCAVLSLDPAFGSGVWAGAAQLAVDEPHGRGVLTSLNLPGILISFNLWFIGFRVYPKTLNPKLY